MRALPLITTKMCGFSTPFKRDMAAANASFLLRALEPKARIADCLTLGPRDSLRTCLNVTVHVQTVDALNYIFWCITVPVVNYMQHTYKEGA